MAAHSRAVDDVGTLQDEQRFQRDRVPTPTTARINTFNSSPWTRHPLRRTVLSQLTILTSPMNSVMAKAMAPVSAGGLSCGYIPLTYHNRPLFSSYLLASHNAEDEALVLVAP